MNTPPMNIRPFYPSVLAETEALNAAVLAEAPTLFYLQSRLVINGSTAMWMTRDFDGYSADVRKAHVFTRAEADALELSGHSLQLWPKAQIDQLTRPTVSLEELRKAKS